MAIRTDIRIHDQGIDGFDYELRSAVSDTTLTVWHSGQYAGKLATENPGVWTVLAPVEWNNQFVDHASIAWTTNGMGAAVEFLHWHWANQG